MKLRLRVETSFKDAAVPSFCFIHGDGVLRDDKSLIDATFSS